MGKRLKNKNVGAKVRVCDLLVGAKKGFYPDGKWIKLKNVSGVIVERGEHEQYYHTACGDYSMVTKRIIENDCYPTYAIKLDYGVTDIEGNNIVVIRDWDLKFLDFLPKSVKVITKREYNRAKKLISKYHDQQTLL